MEEPSRIEAARRNLQRSRYAIGVTAGVVFATAGLLARAAHPGSAGHKASTAGAPASIPTEPSAFQEAAAQAGFFGGGSSISPSAGSAPAVQSAGS